MQQAFLVEETGEGRRFAVGASLLVGRAPDCAVILDDTGVSRHHAEVRREGNAFLWQDLRSTNGVLFNGQRLQGGELRHGDRLQIGETVLRFDAEDMSDAVIGLSTAADLGTPAGLSTAPFFRQAILDEQGRMVASPSGGKSGDLLQAIYAVMNEISSNYDPCNLVDRILDTTVRAIRAQRGAVLFAQPPSEDLLPCPICGQVHLIENGQIQHVESAAFRISSTVAQRVVRRGESVLFHGGGGDAELGGAESIMSLQLRSIICVPLRGKSGILGILYVDTSSPGRTYAQEDFVLMTAVGNSAGLALENATMHRQLLEKQRMEQEIEYAWTIQEGFLVKQWPTEELRYAVYGETRPARVVGGDFYDYVKCGPDRVGLLVGDVSGKGIPAALTMARLLAEFRLHALHADSPAAVIRELSEDLFARSKRGMFCTMSYLILDLNTGRLLCANAGHHPALRVSKGDVTLFGDASGPPAGVLPGGTWTDAEIQLEPGDSVLLYTDGIIEASAPQVSADIPDHDHEFGIENLKTWARNLHGVSPKMLVDAVNEQVAAHCAPVSPHDDCTMIALKYTPDKRLEDVS